MRHVAKTLEMGSEALLKLFLWGFFFGNVFGGVSFLFLCFGDFWGGVVFFVLGLLGFLSPGGTKHLSLSHAAPTAARGID